MTISSTTTSTNSNDSTSPVNIINVWKWNLREEFVRINEIVQKYDYVSVDTEFPGVVATPIGETKNKQEFNFRQLILNVAMLKLIQVGIAFMDEDGNLPPGKPIWQFNFEFDLHGDMYSTASVNLLKKCGIDFEKHKTDGISMLDFGELLTTSGLLANPRIHWLSFGSSFDFSYLIKAILCRQPPEDKEKFFSLFKTLFPSCIDIRVMLDQPGPSSVLLRGGLQEIASMLQVERIGAQHTAGSDALLTAKTYFTIKQRFFNNNWDEVFKKIRCELSGLSPSPEVN
uniref:poly(A)-specific ribonuclease n=1 Tax=Parastrongyloides trichosuri TaxID=131310 RepID=A0A0N4ZNB6_PARTI